MTMASAPAAHSASAPSLSTYTFVTILVSGAIATVFFDLFGQAISPMLGFAGLAPVPLATQTWGVVFGQPYTPGGHLLHYVAGLFAYPFGYMFIWRPIVERILPLPWLLSSILYGVGLWVFALYIMAHLIAGNPAFLGFTGITWVALVGHILFAVVAAIVIRARGQ
ncbi:MAG: hypothetical protein KTR19_07275 [Hyphomicrobiales bacterium]|nr:hypothetical protein [Hyphomicrobiales bacterium]